MKQRPEQIDNGNWIWTAQAASDPNYFHVGVSASETDAYRDWHEAQRAVERLAGREL